MPEKALGAGRLQKIQKDHLQARVELIRDGKLLTFQIDPATEILGCLQEGDLIAITADQKIILLAPAKGPLPPRNFVKGDLVRWNQYMTALREFFVGQGFMELKTPSMVPCPGTEPTLDVFSTELKVGSRHQKLFLPTSPELHLKKALALGAEKIFEIASCYRNGEITERHQPEFLMLEWYRAYNNLSAIKQDVVNLVSALAAKLARTEPKNIKTYSVAELFKIHCSFTLTPQTTLTELKDLGLSLGVDVHSAESIDDYFFLIFMEKIESKLNPDELIFVEKYPPYQAALARLTEDGWGDRFEVYWQGFELANAFHELNNPVVQRLRSEEDLEKKKQLGKEEVFLDTEFFQCLEAGMPPSGGIALGVERLFMALMGIKNISQVKLFPYL
jgi:lysyl-tRNA synthetase class 2